MEKTAFFNSIKFKTTEFTLLNGQVIQLKELSSAQRMSLPEVVKNKKTSMAQIVVWGCDILDDSDVDQVAAMPFDLVKNMADAILKISGIDSDEDKSNLKKS